MDHKSFIHHQNFSQLPRLQQEKLIQFFNREHHYLIQPEDINSFLSSGTRFEVITDIDSLFVKSQADNARGLLAHKQPWEHQEQMLSWMSQLSPLPNQLLVTIMTRSFCTDKDLKDEWYILSYQDSA
ncbi:hypothetical protein EDC56_0253 [Sinobacterium caligoides]|uniref:Uncharacterized protein n=1 Tax=Sinobacterium caligoides TaxID=933926 RepID=A0A3N2DXZ4_9GAMM|nr:hypothetical protein [Sinobacterium caligoides]ROS04740.1 hypothetical protein EDC56_0253 [Sinobacterium caligoides]